MSGLFRQGNILQIFCTARVDNLTHCSTEALVCATKPMSFLHVVMACGVLGNRWLVVGRVVVGGLLDEA
jgi:hypothetical protein